MAAGREVDIGVDGGIETHTAPQVVEAGANILVAGTSIFNSKHSVAEGIQALRAVLPQQ